MDNLEERLAEEVRKHANLYEVSARNYKDHQMSINSWEQISQNLGLSVKECKIKWKNMRDRYTCVRKSNKQTINNKNKNKNNIRIE